MVVIDIHGFGNINSGYGSGYRALWGTIVGVMSVIAALMVAMLLGAYKRVAVHTFAIRHASLPLPDIGLCLKQPWAYHRIERAEELRPVLHAAESLSPNVEGHKKLGEVLSEAMNGNMRAFYEEYFLKCEDHLIYCMFDNAPIDCCAMNLTFVYVDELRFGCVVLERVGNMTDLSADKALTVLIDSVGPKRFSGQSTADSNCDKLNSKNDENTNNGKSNANNSDEKLKRCVTTSIKSILKFFDPPCFHDIYNGVKVILSKRFRILGEDMVVAPPGFHTMVNYREQVFQREINCTNDGKEHGYEASSSCYNSCEREVVAERCNCSAFAFLGRQHYFDQEINGSETHEGGHYPEAICNPLSLTACTMEGNGNDSFLAAVSRCYAHECQDLCNEAVFNLQLGQGLLSDEWLGETLEGKLAAGGGGRKLLEFSKDFVAISVLIRDLSVKYVVEKRLDTIPNYLSLIGGQMGLWIGCSVITIIQVFSFLLQKLLGGKKLKESATVTEIGDNNEYKEKSVSIVDEKDPRNQYW